jgi:peptidyl-prolyl cis-trans isomerase C
MRLLKEPLLHFLLIGAGLFLLFARVGDPGPERTDRIVVTADDVEQMATLWSRRWQRPPTPAEREGLVQAQIREEVLYREALTLGLETDDTIVRRRMAQKMEFLLEDLAPPREPTDAELEAFLRDNAERFRQPARYSFTHVYLSTDKRGEQALQDARFLLDDLRIRGQDADVLAVSDPFMLDLHMKDRTEHDISRAFGREFVAVLRQVPVGRWHGPVESAYGVHLVLVRERIGAPQPELAEVRDRVRDDLLHQRRQEANEAMIERLKERYEILVEAADQGLSPDLAARAQ